MPTSPEERARRKARFAAAMEWYAYDAETLTDDELREYDATWPLTADGFDEAFLGLARRNHQLLAVYSRQGALELLEEQMLEGCERRPHTWDCGHWGEAVEYFEFNVVGAWVGEYTPLWLEDEEDDEALST